MILFVWKFHESLMSHEQKDYGDWFWETFMEIIHFVAGYGTLKSTYSIRITRPKQMFLNNSRFFVSWLLKHGFSSNKNLPMKKFHQNFENNCAWFWASERHLEAEMRKSRKMLNKGFKNELRKISVARKISSAWIQKIFEKSNVE